MVLDNHVYLRVGEEWGEVLEMCSWAKKPRFWRKHLDPRI